MKVQKIIIFIIIIVLSGMASIAFYLWNHNQNKLEALRLIGISPTKGMRVLNYHKEGAMDWFIRVRIEIDSGSVDDFINNSPFKGKTLGDESVFYEDDFPRWWKPNNAENLLSGEFLDLDNGESFKILINLDHESKAIIFIQWFET